jgi:hypothetical protein
MAVKRFQVHTAKTVIFGLGQAGVHLPGLAHLGYPLPFRASAAARAGLHRRGPGRAGSSSWGAGKERVTGGEVAGNFGRISLSCADARCRCQWEISRWFGGSFSDGADLGPWLSEGRSGDGAHSRAAWSRRRSGGCLRAARPNRLLRFAGARRSSSLLLPDTFI